MGRRLGRGPRQNEVTFDDLSAGEQELAQRADALFGLLLETVVVTFRLYLELAPDGRELHPDEEASVRERLAAGALCGRTLDRDRDLIEYLGEDYDLRPGLAAVRAMQQSLVLALSDDPELRKRAMHVDELRTRLRPVYEGLLEIAGHEPEGA